MHTKTQTFGICMQVELLQTNNVWLMLRESIYKNNINRSTKGQKKKEDDEVQKIRQRNGVRRPFQKRGEFEKPDE